MFFARYGTGSDCHIFSTGTEMVSAHESKSTYEPVAVNTIQSVQESDISETVTVIPMVAEEVSVEPEEELAEPLATQEEIELLALCVMAEAEGECEYGQRLVIDVVLNRVDDPHFPDTIYDVIYQKNQFAGMYGDRITRCYVKDELVQLVKEELENRTNEDVVFFRTGHYHSYGVPMFQVGAHYFRVTIKGGVHYEELSKGIAVLCSGDHVGTVSGRRDHYSFVREAVSMEGFANLVSMLDYAVNTRRKRHITGGLLISAALLLGGLAITVISVHDEEDNYDE